MKKFKTVNKKSKKIIKNNSKKVLENGKIKNLGQNTEGVATAFCQKYGLHSPLILYFQSKF